MSVYSRGVVFNILLSAPDVGLEEKKAVMRAIDGGWIAPTGPELDLFESEMAQYLGASYAVALSSGTAALHLSLLSVGVSPGDSVILPSMTFVATANAVVYAGATPVFVDSTHNGNLDPNVLAEAIVSELKDGNNIGAVVPVDLYGHMADYEEILPLVASFGIPVVVDSAESLGASRNSLTAGALGEISILSFNGNKIMTTSGGGMALSKDSEKIDYVRYLATQARLPEQYYEHDTVGFNYRMSNVLAAIGRAQLRRLPGMIGRRREIRNRYRDFFSNVSGIDLLNQESTGDNYWLTAIKFTSDEIDHNAEFLLRYLAGLGIETRRLWKPMHLQPLYREAKFYGGNIAEQLFRRGLALPSGSSLADSDIDQVLEKISQFLGFGRQ